MNNFLLREIPINLLIGVKNTNGYSVQACDLLKPMRSAAHCIKLLHKLEVAGLIILFRDDSGHCFIKTTKKGGLVANELIRLKNIFCSN